jgi:hypothetical protein
LRVTSVYLVADCVTDVGFEPATAVVIFIVPSVAEEGVKLCAATARLPTSRRAVVSTV